MKTLILITMVLQLALTVYVEAQAPETLWTRTYEFSLWHEAWQLKQTFDGGLIITGHTNMPRDIFLMKTNSDGDTIWTKSYVYSGSDIGRSVELLDDGGFLLTGVTGDSCVLIRTDSLGNEIWRTNPGGSYGRAVRLISDGNIIVAGFAIGSGNYDDIFVAKTDSDGNLIWSETYGGAMSERASDVLETPDNGFAILGWTESFGIGSDFYLIRIDENGDSLWSRTYDYSNEDEGRSFILKEDGGFVIAGKIFDYSTNTGTDIFVINADSNGDTIWTRSYILDGDQVGNSIAAASDGGYVIAGADFSGPYRSHVIKIDHDGNQLWSVALDNSYLRSIVQTYDGGYEMTGYRGYSSGAYFIFNAKLAADEVGINESTFHIPDQITLRQNYPNPFNANTTISFTLLEQQDVNLIVYDLLGRKVEVLLDGTAEAGNHRIIFDASEYPSGVYFYRMMVGNTDQTKPMILLK